MVGKLWFRTTTACYYCLYNGKQVRLAKGKENLGEAEVAHAKLVLADNAKSVDTDNINDDSPCKYVLQAHMDYQKGKIADETFRRSGRVINTFIKMWGDVPTSSLKRHHFTSWIAAHPTWNATTQHGYIGELISSFTWAMVEEHVTRNPAKMIKRPKPLARGKEAIISKAEYELLLEKAKPYMKMILQALYYTGCRPSEVLNVTAADYDASAKCWMVEDHKTKDKVGIKAVCLTNFMCELTETLITKFPIGTLFRNAKGKPLTARNLCPALDTLRRKCGITRKILPYYGRHTFCHDLLMANVPDSKVAALLGHTTTRYVSSSYGHMKQKAMALQSDLEAARG